MGRRGWAIILLAAVLVLGVGATLSRKVTTKTPTVRGEENPVEGTKWSGLSPYPKLPDTGFWAPDLPMRMDPLAFGKLPAENAVVICKPPVRGYHLSVDLPNGQDQLPVYLVGRYPEDYENRFHQIIGDQPGWRFSPAYSLFHFPGPSENYPPQGDVVQTDTSDKAIQRATELLRPFVWPDSDIPEVEKIEGGWRIFFRQQVDGIRIDQDKPIQAEINRNGQLTYALGRRRPLMYVSSYPARSARDAWSSLESGKGFGVTLLNHRPAPPSANTFSIAKVGLSYFQTHVTLDLEVMQPYWVFENESGEVQFIPAVADPYVRWPVAGRETC